jgi:hypothetical protein
VIAMDAILVIIPSYILHPPSSILHPPSSILHAYSYYYSMEDKMMMEDGDRVEVNLYGNISQATKRWNVK